MSQFLIYSILLISVVLAGGLIITYSGKGLLKHLNLMLAFGGAFLIALVFLHLIPELFVGAEASGLSARSIGWFALGGFMLQIILEYFSKGIEHGHHHEHSGQKHFPFMVFLSLCIHAFIEAMPLAGGVHDHHHHHDHLHFHLEGNALLIGILIHKLPVALVLAGILVGSEISKWKAWLYLAIFGLMPIAGMFLGDMIIHADGIDANYWMSAFTAILIGILFHISTTILFETSEGHRFNLQKLITVLVGIGIAALTL